jgi:WD40 repeat protein
MADAFLSYARGDADIVRSIHSAMESDGREVWVDWEGIPPTAEWMAEIYAAIEAADYFVFVISPHSVTSEVCRLEIDHALGHNKRIVPLLVHPVDEALLNPEVAKLNWIAFDRKDTFESSLGDLRTAVTADLDYIRAHTRLLVRAREWESQRNESSLLLRGADLANSEALLRNECKPAITPLQTRYVAAGQRAAARRRSTIGAAMVVALLIAIGLAAWALVQRSIARENEALAVRREQTAKRLQFDSDMKLALREWESGRVGGAISLLEAHRDRAELFIWRYLKGLTRTDRAVVNVHRAISVFLTADGRTVYTGGDDSGLQRWDVTTQQAEQLSPREDRVNSIDMTKDGRFLAWVQKGRVHLLDLERNERRQPPMSRARSVRFSPDGTRLAVAKDPAIVLWDIASWRQVWQRPYRGFLGAVSIAFIPGSDLLALGDDKGKIIVWNIESDTLEAQLQAPQGRKMYSMAAATTAHGQLEVWRVDGWQRRQLADVYHNSPTDGMLAFSADGHFLASPDGSIVKIWDLRSSQLVKSYRGHKRSISSLSWSADNEHIASGSYDGTVRVWKAIRDQRFTVRRLPIEWHPDEMLIRMSPDREYLLIGFTVLDVYNQKTLQHMATLGHGQPVARTVFSAEAKLVATVTGPYDEQPDWPGPELRIWDLQTGNVRSQLPIHGRWIGQIEFHDEGRRLRFEVEHGDETSTVHTWDIADGRFIENGDHTAQSAAKAAPDAPGPAPWAGAKNVIVAPGGVGAATRIRGNLIRLWPVSGGDPVQLTTHKAGVAEMAFSPDAQTLASITDTVLDVESPNGELKLWDAETGAELATFMLDGYLQQVGFTGDGSILSAAASDGRVFRFIAPLVELTDPGVKSPNNN